MYIYIKTKMVNIVLTEKQLKVITDKVLIEDKSNKETLNESLFSFESFLMAAGFIPVIGEIADIALICYYLYNGQKLYAALMLIALIPTVGDFIVKPIIKLFKGSREGMSAVKAGGKTLTEYLTKNPKMAQKFSGVMKHVNDPRVEKTVQNISKVNSTLGSRLKSGLSELVGTGNVVSGLKAGGKEVIAGGKFKTGLKGYFQGQRLSKYFAKHGVLPEAGIKRWWLNVSARRDRRNAFRNFIAANNLLAYFGIPSLKTFEDKMSNDPEFRTKVAEDPKTSDYIAQNYEAGNQTNGKDETSKQETDGFNGDKIKDVEPQTTSSSGGDFFSDLIGDMLGGQMLKTKI
jgi:hypothetical protein